METKHLQAFQIRLYMQATCFNQDTTLVHLLPSTTFQPPSLSLLNTFYYKNKEKHTHLIFNDLWKVMKETFWI